MRCSFWICYDGFRVIGSFKKLWFSGIGRIIRSYYWNDWSGVAYHRTT